MEKLTLYVGCKNLVRLGDGHASWWPPAMTVFEQDSPIKKLGFARKPTLAG